MSKSMWRPFFLAFVLGVLFILMLHLLLLSMDGGLVLKKGFFFFSIKNEIEFDHGDLSRWQADLFGCLVSVSQLFNLRPTERLLTAIPTALSR